VDDFDSSPLTKLLVPSSSNAANIEFKLTILDDNVVEEEEVFVVVLEAMSSGAGTVTVTRGCTVIRIPEHFSGQCKHGCSSIVPPRFYPKGGGGLKMNGLRTNLWLDSHHMKDIFDSKGWS